MRMMMDQGLSLNSVVLTAILPIIGDLQDRILGRKLHGYVMKRRYSKQLLVQTGLIDMYCNCGDMTYDGEGKESHAYSMKRGFLANFSVITCLMAMYSKCEVIAGLFESLPERNVICWTAMIDSYVESGFAYEALDMFRSMQLSWYRPDSIVFSRILNVCSQLKAGKLGKEIHGQILEKNLQANPYISAELIRTHASCQSIGSAASVFETTSIKG
ncbi:hypothetical protein MLD38_021495 [Melastoma candidum]|uniref:Uncharacterized protein n=1 Tax=Melastoma candidum TaxID=119954 RepID=A0ACB9QG99_9MYRT|nr:hypothetical protein MLD38_021495 [Melastoma candidum]